MTWEEFLEGARALRTTAARKISDMTDTAADRVRLATVEYQLKAAYAEFGKAAYQHFTADVSTPEELAAHVKQIALLEAEAAELREVLEKNKK